MLWAAASLCFFGFFRSGELFVPTLTAFDERVHLAWGDVAVDNQNNPSSLRVHLKRSKCDQFGRGVDVYVGRTGSCLCPVAAVLAYMVSRGPGPGPFFRLNPSTPLTKPRFVAAVREALLAVGVSPHLYAGHSFRIGAATSASRAGLQDSFIQAMGRWSSAAFLSYIRTPPEQLAAASRQLDSCAV